MASKLPEVIEHTGRCRQVVEMLEGEQVLAVDCEGISLGVDGPLTLVQVGNYSGKVYLFDILRNKYLLSRGRLGTLFESSNIVKVRVFIFVTQCMWIFNCKYMLKFFNHLYLICTCSFHA